jgi:hypothetical protein
VTANIFADRAREMAHLHEMRQHAREILDPKVPVAQHLSPNSRSTSRSADRGSS